MKSILLGVEQPITYELLKRSPKLYRRTKHLSAWNYEGQNNVEQELLKKNYTSRKLSYLDWSNHPCITTLNFL